METKAGIRRYYQADVYALDYTNLADSDSEEDIESRIKHIGKFVVTTLKINDGYHEAITGKRLGVINMTNPLVTDFKNGLDYPNLYVDCSSLIPLNAKEKEQLLSKYPTQDRNEIEMFLCRKTILNGSIPRGKSFFKAKIVNLKPGFEDEYIKNGYSVKGLEKYINDFGSYIVSTTKDKGTFVEILTGEVFGSYAEEIGPNQMRDPRYHIDKYSSGKYPLMFVDREHKELIEGKELQDRFEAYYYVITGEELKDFFDKTEKDLEEGKEPVQFGSEVSLTMKGKKN